MTGLALIVELHETEIIKKSRKTKPKIDSDSGNLNCPLAAGAAGKICNLKCGPGAVTRDSHVPVPLGHRAPVHVTAAAGRQPPGQRRPDAVRPRLGVTVTADGDCDGDRLLTVTGLERSRTSNYGARPTARHRGRTGSRAPCHWQSVAAPRPRLAQVP